MPAMVGGFGKIINHPMLQYYQWNRFKQVLGAEREKNFYFNMPQLIPFSFVSSIIAVIIFLGVTIWVLSVIILPLFPRLQLSRLFIIYL